MPRQTHELPCKCLTAKGVFALIRGFPNGFNRCTSRWASSLGWLRATAFRRAARARGRSRARPAAPSLFGPGGNAPAISTPALITHLHHETHLPALESPPRPHAWIPDAHEDSRRSRRDQRAARQRPQAPVVGLTDARVSSRLRQRCSAACSVRPISSTRWPSRPARGALTSPHTTWLACQAAAQPARPGPAQPTCPQAIQKLAHSLWMNLFCPRRTGAGSAPLCPSAMLAKRPLATCCGARSGPRWSVTMLRWRTAFGWCACARPSMRAATTRPLPQRCAPRRATSSTPC